MKKFQQTNIKNTIAGFAMLLCGMVVLTACNHSADVDDNDNSATGGKGVSFTLSMVDWEDAPTVGMPATKATARSTEQLEKSMVVDLSPEVSANVTVIREGAEAGATGAKTRAATRTPLPAGDYTIIAYQGTDAAPVKKAEITATWNGSMFTISGKQAKMHLDPGTYTFVCFNNKLEEKNGKLSMAQYDRDKVLSNDDDYATYLKTLESEYDEALVGRATATVNQSTIRVPFVLSHPWARVKFSVIGICLKRPETDTDYSSSATPVSISYNADLSGTTTMVPANNGGAAATVQTLSAHELNPLSLTPVNYTESDVDLTSGAEKLNNKRAFKLDNFVEYPASSLINWMNGYRNKYQEYQSMNLYFPAGANLKQYKWHSKPVGLFGRQTSFDKLYEAVRNAFPETLAANSSYKVLIHVSYNFRYIFSDGTIGTIAENNNWATKQPIAIITSMKTRTAMSLYATGGRKNWTKIAPTAHFNRRYYTPANASEMANDMSGYRTTYDPAYTYDGTLAHADNPDLPAFYEAAHYKPAGVTASWILHPSGDVNDSIGKWYLPSTGEWLNAYRTIGHGTGYNLDKQQQTPPLYNEWFEWRIILLDIAFRQAGSEFYPGWNYYWSCNELTRQRPNEDYAVQLGWRTDGRLIFRRDTYNLGVVVPFIHF